MANDMKGQRIAHIAQVTCFESILRFAVLFTLFFLPDAVVKMIDLLRSVVSLG